MAPAKDIESAGSADTSVSTMGKAVRQGDGGEEVAVELREWNVVASRLGDDPRDNGDGGDAGALASGAVAGSALAHAPVESSARREAGENGAVDHGRSGSPSLSSAPSSSSSAGIQPAVPRPVKAFAAGGNEKEGEKEKEKDVVPDAIGRETCPICIVDFEEGDDLRVLPCEGHHRFHQECVDQWLLELSSSCPLCRQGALCLLLLFPNAC